MMTWGIELINNIKFNQPITWKDVFHPFHVTQIIYSIVTFYLCRIFLKKIISTRKYVWSIPALLIIIISFIGVRYLLEEILCPLLINYKNYTSGTPFLFYVLDNIYFALIYIILGSTFYLLDIQVQQQKEKSELLQKSREAELQFLRSQINPHFLFNTLNNIHALVYEKSDQAPGAVLQLSELMRYILYEKKDKVPLDKEWDYIQHFIALQQLRFEKPVEMDIIREGDSSHILIPPYLFIPFFENAFKHGDFKKDPLQASLVCNQKQVSLKIRNKIAHIEKDKTGGIGLENVQKRLNLLYPNQHELIIDQSNNYFTATLNIQTD